VAHRQGPADVGPGREVGGKLFSGSAETRKCLLGLALIRPVSWEHVAQVVVDPRQELSELGRSGKSAANCFTIAIASPSADSASECLPTFLSSNPS
jgi:hypothetical protein